MKGGIVERNSGVVREMRPKPMPLPPNANVLSAPTSFQPPSSSIVSRNMITAQLQVPRATMEEEEAEEGLPLSENDHILNSMTPEELQEAYAEITSLLSAKNIAFLKGSRPVQELNADIGDVIQSTQTNEQAEILNEPDQAKFQPNNLNDMEQFDMSGMRLWQVEDVVACISKLMLHDIPHDTLTEIAHTFAASGFYKLVNEDDELDANSVFTMHRLIEVSSSRYFGF